MEEPSNRLSPKVRLMWRWTAGLGAVLLFGVLLLISLLTGLPPWIPGVVALVVVGVAVSLPPLRYRRWRYEIRVRDLYFSKGALLLVRTVVPFDRIQYVETRQGPVDRAFKLHQLVVYTGAGRAGSIPGLEEAEAQRLRDELSKVAGAVSL